MPRFGKIVAALVLFLISLPTIAAPDTVASVRARAHQEIAQRDAKIVELQQKIAVQQKQIDEMHKMFAEALQNVKTLRASLVAAGVLPAGSSSGNPTDVADTSASSPALQQFIPASSSMSGYVFVPPPHAVPTYLMKFEKLVDKYVKLHPDVIPSVKEMNGHIEWVEVDDAQQFDTANYYADAYVLVTYPVDPVRNEMQLPNSREKARFDVNLNTGVIRYAGHF